MKIRQKLRFKVNMGVLNTLAKVEKTIHGNAVNIFSDAYRANPQAEFVKVRPRGELYYSMALRAWWATGFEVVRDILRDPRFSSDVRRFEKRAKKLRAQIGDNQQRLESFENPSMLSLDPPDHTRIRRLATHAFVSKYIQSLEPRIDNIVCSRLASVDNATTFDVMENLAKPLPAIVIAEMMGLPESDHAQFQAWSEDLIAGSATSDLVVAQNAERSRQALVAYFADIIRQRRSDNPIDSEQTASPAQDDATDGGDLIDQLMAAEEAGDKLNELELYNTCLLLLVAGHETTTRLIGNGLYWLLQNPDQLAQLQQNQALMTNAVEEMLRFDPPVLATQRFVLEDMDFHGHKLRHGDAIFVSLTAANRDPAANENADSFDINRDKVNQVSFGYGIHLCIGAALARLEGKVALNRLLERFPNLSLDGDPQWGGNAFFRGFDQLMVNTGNATGAAPGAASGTGAQPHKESVASSAD